MKEYIVFGIILSPKSQTWPTFGIDMGEQSEVEETPPKELPVSKLTTNGALDFDTGIRHIIAPALIGLILGALSEQFLTPNYAWPSPPQAAMIGSILLSPLMYVLLVRDELSRIWEYSIGMTLPGLFFIMIWFSGWGALFCGGYGAILIWVWISTSWGQYKLPPFRYGFWHAFAINIGGFAGALITFGITS